MSQKIIYSLFAILIAIVIIYFNSLGNGYNMDDSLVMTDNQLVENGSLGKIFTQYSYQSGTYNFAYRPLVIASFYLENIFFGKSPLVSHAINLILYIILNFIVFFLLLKFSNNVFSSLIITLLFLSLPLHTEVVDNIKNRDELFVSILGFLSIYFTITSIRNGKMHYLILIFLLSVLGFFVKQSFIIFPFLIAISAFLYCLKLNFYKKITIFFKYFIISGSAMLVNIFVKYYYLNKINLNRTFEYYENPLFFSSLTERVFPSIYIIGYYISLLINPFNLSYYYGYDAVNFHDYFSLNFILGLLFLISIIGVFIYHEKMSKLLIIGISLLFINIIAISNFALPLPGIIAERFIFNGSLGYCILIYLFLLFITSYIKKIKLRNTILFLFTLLFVISFGLTSMIRNKDWKDELTLYSHDITNIPNSVKANEMLAGNYYKQFFEKNDTINLTLSEKHYLNAIKIYPSHPACLNNLGTIHFLKKDYQKAIYYYLKTLKLNPKSNVHYNLATCYLLINNIPSAKKEYESALLENPEDSKIFSHYKQLIINNNLIVESISFLETEALIKHNKSLNIYLLLIDLHNELKDYKIMLKYLKITNNIKPNINYINYINQIEQFLANEKATKNTKLTSLEY